MRKKGDHDKHFFFYKGDILLVISALNCKILSLRLPNMLTMLAIEWRNIAFYKR